MLQRNHRRTRPVQRPSWAQQVRHDAERYTGLRAMSPCGHACGMQMKFRCLSALPSPRLCPHSSRSASHPGGHGGLVQGDAGRRGASPRRTMKRYGPFHGACLLWDGPYINTGAREPASVGPLYTAAATQGADSSSVWRVGDTELEKL